MSRLVPLALAGLALLLLASVAGAEVLPVDGPCRIKLRSGRVMEARGLEPVGEKAAFWRIRLDGNNALVVPARELRRVEVIAVEPEQPGIVPLEREGTLLADGEQAKGCDPARDPRLTRWDELLAGASQRHGLEVQLVRAVVAVESCGDPDAVSRKGAVGLMQLMPATAAGYGCANPRDPSANVEAGCAHLAYLQRKLGDVQLALAAYNAGERAVQRHQGIPKYRETQSYVKNVLAHRERLLQAEPAM